MLKEYNMFNLWETQYLSCDEILMLAKLKKSLGTLSPRPHRQLTKRIYPIVDIQKSIFVKLGRVEPNVKINYA